MAKVTIGSKVDIIVKSKLEDKAQETGLTLSNLVERILHKLCRNKEALDNFCNF